MRLGGQWCRISVTTIHFLDGWVGPGPGRRARRPGPSNLDAEATEPSPAREWPSQWCCPADLSLCKSEPFCKRLEARALPAWTPAPTRCVYNPPSHPELSGANVDAGVLQGMSSCGQMAVWLRGIWESGTTTPAEVKSRPVRLVASFLVTTPGLRTASASWDGDAGGVRRATS